MRRLDSYPAPAEKAVLEGRSLPSPSPRYELAASVRRLNAILATLPVERQAALQDSWHASWAELERQRQAADDDAAELAAIEGWREHWTERLTHNGRKQP